MKPILLLFTATLALAAAPLAAQETPRPSDRDLSAPAPEGGAIETVETAQDDGGLSFTVTDESEWQDLGIAIPGFATDRDVPTQASSGGTAALGKSLAQVVYNDLKFNGLFKPVGPNSLPQPSYPEITAPSWPTWSNRSAEMLVEGYVRARGDGKLIVGCYLYDVQLQKELTRGGWVVPPADWRRAAHKCSDLVYSRLSGESPFFDSRIAYIAETGPKDHRVKRLAIMDFGRRQSPVHHQWPGHCADSAIFARLPAVALSQLRRWQPAALRLRHRHRAPASGDAEQQPHFRPALEPGWQVDPLLDGDWRKHRYLSRIGARRAERAPDQRTRHRYRRLLFARWNQDRF